LEVLLKCGKPTLWEETGSAFSQKVEKWYYNCGSHKFIQILRFKSGVLERIKLGGYGKGKSDCMGAARREREKEKRSSTGKGP